MGLRLEPRITGSKTKYANHCAMLAPLGTKLFEPQFAPIRFANNFIDHGTVQIVEKLLCLFL